MPDRLDDLHGRINDLTDPDGDFAVVCLHSGERPVPVKGQSFPTPEAAEDAVDLVREYREALREINPYLETVSLAAVEMPADPLSLDVTGERAARERDCPHGGTDSSRANGSRRDRAGGPTRSVTVSGNDEEAWLRMDDAPVVRVREDGELLDDAAIERQLNAKL